MKGRRLIASARRLLGSKFIQDTLALQAGKIGTVGLSFISSLLVWRLMGPAAFGVFALAQTFLNLWRSLDLTGIGTSTNTRLAIAVGAEDEGEILNLMAFYVQVAMSFTLGLTALIVLLGPPIAGLLYEGDTRVGELAALLALGMVADEFYLLVLTALQSRRMMRALALMQNANQFVLTTCSIAAVLISPTPESLVIGRLVYSYSTLALAIVVYGRLRTQGGVDFPPLRAVFARARTLSPRPYWRFGVANAVDKNISNLFTQIPVQIVGAVSGASAAGYLRLALDGIAQASILSSAVFDNMQAVVPQAVGRGDLAGLRRNFTRVLLVVLVGAIGFFSLLALASPLVVPPLLGGEWTPAIPALIILCLYGAITSVGGLFAPIYRAFNLMRQAIGVKLISVALALPAGALLTARLVERDRMLVDSLFGVTQLIPAEYSGATAGSIGGALTIVALYALSVSLTAVVTLRKLRVDS